MTTPYTSPISGQSNVSMLITFGIQTAAWIPWSSQFDDQSLLGVMVTPPVGRNEIDPTHDPIHQKRCSTLKRSQATKDSSLDHKTIDIYICT